ncbi:ketoacyl-ACP synthase III [Cryobacterium sp. TMS1-20-1]|uniref:ketoacyl-ACP synthase III n=1 Tax=Cryobacterium sp. TMS1-20-1 TaxID=1259223 RepID=UPI00106A0F79|nr:ketoacyl-ACP synthase III [Cryobacterium sp. TMS1-20-1]TFC70141.1 ketoacyl-ACP synthase III [Cryobacterium sp. TMS1-20-1]
MRIETVSGVMIEGVVACLPENLIDNRDACADLFGDSVDTLIKATGIQSRAIANPGTTALDLNLAAARKLIELTRVSLDDIGAVICVTFTPEYLLPSDAPAAQSALALSNNTIAFDISMACSGYGYGLYVAALLVKSTGKKVLLLDGDVQSAFVSKLDKSTYPVMADAGSATLLSPNLDSADEWKFAFFTDGGGREDLFIPAGGSKIPVDKEQIRPRCREDGSSRSQSQIYMDGFGIFKFVAQTASRFIEQFMSQIQLNPAELDTFVPHQANMYMINQLARKLKIENSKIWKSGDKFGNPASASIPLTIAYEAGKLGGDERAQTLIAGFGGGLSISVGLISLKKSASYALIKYTKEEN